MCGLAVLNDDERGDDLLTDAGVRDVISAACGSTHEVLRRLAVPLAERLG